MTPVDIPTVIRDVSSHGFVRVNRTFTELLGYEADQLASQTLLEWVHPQDRKRLQAVIDHGSGALKCRHRTRNDEWLAFDWNIRTEDQTCIAMGTLHRENPVFKTEIPAHQGDSMAEILAAMALIVESWHPGLKCSVLLLDSEHKHVNVGAGPSLPDEYNRAVEGLMIGPAVGSCGTAAYWNIPVIVEDIQNDILWKDLKKPAAKAGLSACWSYPITAKNGEVLGAAALYSPTPQAPTQEQFAGLETVARMFGLAIERGRAEQALRESEEQLRQAAKMKAMGVLAGGLAHDFNNILSIILGNAELGIRAVDVDTKIYGTLREITTACQRTSDLCDQMLAYAGRGKFSSQTLDCNELIREFGGLLEVTLSKKTKLEYQLDDSPLIVKADKAQLGQVLMNLITNAAEAIGNDIGRILVKTVSHFYDKHDLDELFPHASLSTGQYIQVSVLDTGKGISKKTQGNIFDPFYTTKFAGRGLGLAAVQGIVNRHNGSVRLESTLGEGTTFSFLIPVASKTKAEIRSLQNESVTTGIDNHCILVVDDEIQVRTILAKNLEQARFKVISAENGQEAITIFKEKKDSIDCILLDFSMPDLDGEETFRALQKISPDIPVILNSGFAEQEIVDRFYGAGYADVLHKPTPTEKIIAAIQKTLANSGRIEKSNTN